MLLISKINKLGYPLLICIFILAGSKGYAQVCTAPVAGFTVENDKSLCSSDDVLFDNTTTGSITKIVIYYDYDNAPANSTTYTQALGEIPADNIFRHNYGLFNTPASNNYHVKMLAYSGACNSAFDKIIKVNANPIVDVATIGTICQGDAPVQITLDTHGFTGNGVFTGTGVSPTGLFNPTVAGPGKFNIDYVFMATTGCTYSYSQVAEVNPNPKTDAGTELFVLEGGHATMMATASGIEPLKYKWTLANGSPATGLDRDDILDPVVAGITDITYMLTVTSGEGCTASSNVKITVLKSPVIPNAFTPNADGINDTWDIKYLNNYPNCTVDVFNRGGVKIYSSVGYPQPWNGTYKGAALPVGTYYYVINPENGLKVISGSLTIIR